MTAKQVITCSQNACNASRDGKCLEGNELSACKYVTITDIESEDVIDEIDDTLPYSTPGMMHLTGEPLDITGGDIILRERPTRFIIIAGQPESGKTTLITQTYEFLNKGTFANYSFAWSDTIPAYERMCYPSRMSSQRKKPTTNRTTVSDPRFLHLRVQDVEQNDHSVNLLFADIKGETFSNSQLTSTDMKKLTYFSRADHVVLLVDGGKLADPRLRHKEAADARTFLRSLIDNNMIPSRPYIQVLFSRWDLVEQCNDKAGAQTIAQNLEIDFTRDFKNNVSDIVFINIAARPDSDILPLGYNMDKLIVKWVTCSPYIQSNNYTNNLQTMRLSHWLINNEGEAK